MSGVENRFLEATADLDSLHRRGGRDERSLILEEKLNEITSELFDDPRAGLRAVKAYAERRLDELEAARETLEDDPSPAGPRLDDPAFPLDTHPLASGPPEEFFRQERSTFEARRAELTGHEGRYVVIKGEEIAGVWPSYEEAIDGDYDRFGPVPFFVKQIVAGQNTHAATPFPH